MGAIDEATLTARLRGGQWTVLYTVYFVTGKSDIKFPESDAQLNSLQRALAAVSDVKVRVEVHTDSAGQAAWNLKLSQGRAEALVAWLAAHGVAKERMEAVGMGETKPIMPNTTYESRRRNRRVEIAVVRGGK
jgi:outer membrane protein OmpA-like peptidoglycan-associated protein